MWSPGNHLYSALPTRLDCQRASKDSFEHQTGIDARCILRSAQGCLHCCTARGRHTSARLLFLNMRHAQGCNSMVCCYLMTRLVDWAYWKLETCHISTTLSPLARGGGGGVMIVLPWNKLTRGHYKAAFNNTRLVQDWNGIYNMLLYGD